MVFRHPNIWRINWGTNLGTLGVTPDLPRAGNLNPWVVITRLASGFASYRINLISADTTHQLTWLQAAHLSTSRIPTLYWLRTTPLVHEANFQGSLSILQTGFPCQKCFWTEEFWKSRDIVFCRNHSAMTQFLFDDSRVYPRVFKPRSVAPLSVDRHPEQQNWSSALGILNERVQSPLLESWRSVLQQRTPTEIFCHRQYGRPLAPRNGSMENSLA